MKTLEEKKQIFYNWLVEQGVLFNYLKYLGSFDHIYQSLSMYNYLEFLSVGRKNHTFISWNGSVEGFHYWNTLDKKWHDYLKENNIE